MTDAPGRWRGVVRQIGWIAVLFILQIALIVWLSDSSKTPTLKRSTAPTLQILSPQFTDQIELNDPTLFALPHYRSFSGFAWLRAPTVAALPFEWSDRPRWFETSTNEFLTIKSSRASEFALYELVKSAPPPPSAPPTPGISQFPQKSELKIFGFARSVLSPPALPSWSSTNALTNTVVRMMVDGKGITRSQTLLVRSGLPEADDLALNISRNLRFESAASSPAPGEPGSGLIWGEAVFQWQNKPDSNGGRK
jgi:hypothetical protein